ncbi:MAG: hypothetical protein U0T03_10335 [Xanthomonadales bacterium]|nr:hypothetical protein [Xanthomonadales bacterium]
MLLLAVITFVMRVSGSVTCGVDGRILKPTCQYIKDRHSHQHCYQQGGDDLSGFE